MSANGSNPASRAISPFVRRLTLNGAYRSSSACFVGAASNAAVSSAVNLPCSATLLITAARRSSNSRR